jgi:hypothetical protein
LTARGGDANLRCSGVLPTLDTLRATMRVMQLLTPVADEATDVSAWSSIMRLIVILKGLATAARP